MSDKEKEIEAIRQQCDRFLAYHPPGARQPAEMLSALAELAGDLPADRYGEGDILATLEEEVAGVLGKEAAVFMPSGTMAQQIALRIWSERKGTANVAFHPRAHLELHEQQAYRRLHNLQGVLVGHPERLLTLEDLEAVREPLAALLLELPQREIGGQLPSWDELTAIIAWARERGVATHMDGARLWESRPFYQREYTAIAGLFDSVYVSFYKILGGISGAILAGAAGFIAEARVWQRRHGGNLFALYPYALSARLGLQQYLPQMEAYHQKALELAAALRPLAQLEIVPDPPHTNMMHLYLRGEREALEEAALAVARESGVFLFGGLAPAQIPAYHKLELTVGDATLELSGKEVRHLFQRLFEIASQTDESKGR